MALWPAAVAVLTLLLAATAAAGCGADRPPLPLACLAAPEDLAGALAAAPEPVALDDGTTLSACVELAYTPSDLQALGAQANGLADELALRAQGGDEEAAVQLGYLAGAARAGAARTDGVQLELARALESAAQLPGMAPAVARAIDRGVRAGERHG